MGQVKLSPEHKAKLAASRDAYWAKRKAEKAQKIKDEAEAVEPSDLIANSFNGPAKNPVAVAYLEKSANPLSAREKTQIRVNKKLDKLLDAQIDAATGLYYVTADGKHVYKKAPETSTGQYLLNQLIGKPKESIEVKSVNLKIDI